MGTIGSRLKEVRKAYNLTQAQFAKEIAISQTHVSKIEKDVEHPSSSLIRLISTKFNVDETWLTVGVGGMTPGWDATTDEGALSKYNEMQVRFEQTLKARHGVDRINTVQAFSYFGALLSPRNLDASKTTDYLKLICSVIDQFEKFTSIISNEFALPDKNDAAGWLRFRTFCEQSISQIERDMKTAANLYLEKHGEDMKL